MTSKKPPNGNCVLSGFGPCSGKISGEHYISKAVLNQISKSRTILIKGTSWLDVELKRIGKAGLVANVLCQKHNSNFSPFDDCAARFFRAIQDAQTALEAKSQKCRTHTFPGNKLELWFLKTAYMMWVSGNFAHDGKALPGKPPSSWAEILTGVVAFPDQWGFYCQAIDDPFYGVDREFSAMPLTGSNGSGIKAVQFTLNGFAFVLIMGRPDDPLMWGTRRPSQLDIADRTTCHRLRLTWLEDDAGGPVTFSRTADSNAKQPF